jgi:nicotinamidase-related amidase
MAITDVDRYALVVVDAQVGFEAPSWGPRNNPRCDANIERLVAAWHRNRSAVVYVRHDSDDPASPLHPSNAGNQLKPYLRATPDLLVTKKVNSAFQGSPDLHAWLSEARIDGIVVCGITTNHCCETTARVGGNLGYQLLFALDATHTFDREGPNGDPMTAELLAQATATNLHREFATVVATDQVLELVTT